MSRWLVAGGVWWLAAHVAVGGHRRVRSRLVWRLAVPPQKISVNNHLRELRAQKNWTQQNLADKLDVSRQTVNALETGKYDPSLPLAFKLGKLFRLPIEEMFLPD